MRAATGRWLPSALLACRRVVVLTRAVALGISHRRLRFPSRWPYDCGQENIVPDLLLPRRRVHAALLIGFAAAHAHAQTQTPVSNRAVLEPLAGVQVRYESPGPDGSASSPGQFESSLATPAGTLRTTVHAVPLAKQQFQRGDMSFEWADRVLDGKLQVRDLKTGGAAAAWRGRLDASRTAETECEWSPVRSGQSLRLDQNLGDGRAATARLSSSSTVAGQGSRGEFEIVQDSGRWRLNAGIDAAEQGYVAAAGGPESGVGGLMGAQWLLLPHTRLEARYKWKLRSDAEKPPSSVLLATRFDLPHRLSLVTSVETAASDHKASLTLAVPLEIR
jgi:hypothetical protein